MVIIGGGMVGCDLALRMRLKGHADVMILEQNAAILSDDDVFSDRLGVPIKLSEAGVKVRLNARVTGYDGTRITFSDMKDGSHDLRAGTVVAAVGHEANRSLYDALEPILGGRVEMVGTVRAGRRIFDALHDGFFAADRL